MTEAVAAFGGILAVTGAVIIWLAKSEPDTRGDVMMFFVGWAMAAAGAAAAAHGVAA